MVARVGEFGEQALRNPIGLLDCAEGSAVAGCLRSAKQLYQVPDSRFCERRMRQRNLGNGVSFVFIVIPILILADGRLLREVTQRCNRARLVLDGRRFRLAL